MPLVDRATQKNLAKCFIARLFPTGMFLAMQPWLAGQC